MKAFLIALLGLFIIANACKYQEGEFWKEDLEGKVVAIADGDSFTLLTKDKRQKKIRLHGIDCPEKKQPFGAVAKKRLSELIFGKNVKVIVISLDRYKRLVGMVYVEGLNVNEQLLKDGLAWHYKKFDSSDKWSKLEAEAKGKGFGLWIEKDPIAPWEWR